MTDVRNCRWCERELSDVEVQFGVEVCDNCVPDLKARASPLEKWLANVRILFLHNRSLIKKSPGKPVLVHMPTDTAMLQTQINEYVRKGYHVQSQTETTAQLVKPKSFSFGWAFLWFLLLFFGLLIYILYYVSKKDETVYLYIETGQALSPLTH